MEEKYTGDGFTSDSIENFKVDDQIFGFENGFEFAIPSPDFSFSDIPLDSESKEYSFPTTSSGESFSLSSNGWSPEIESSSSPSNDSSDSSDPVLRVISQMLMEENMEDKPTMFHDPLALRDTEKSLYEMIGEQYPYSPDQLHVETEFFQTSNSFNLVDSQLVGSVREYKQSIDSDLLQSVFNNRESVMLFNKGAEEASKFLPVPNNYKLVIDLESNEAGELQNEERTERSRKNHEREDVDVYELRSSKQSAVYIMEESQESELSEMFDKVLLFPMRNNQPGCCDEKQPSNIPQTNGHLNGSSGKGGKSRRARKNDNKETADLRTLLVLCAQAVSVNDSRTANELLKQIRENCSPSGDGSQRLAHYFANALEARLLGSDTGVHNFYAALAFNKKFTAADMLKAYKIYLSACPFKKTSMSYANKMIFNAAEDAKTLHIIDFGILYGFQWPMLIQFLSMRDGGPPKLKITGIELPQVGFRPAERLEETGRRLEKYCKRFNVLFEYNPIVSQNWETIRIEDLHINKREVVAVNCLFRFKNILDETLEVNCPRDAVINLIRKMNPKIYVHAITNGSYNAPFFATRFREALFHFSALFDMFDTCLQRDDQQRLLFEREFYGRECMNVIAREGLQRVERPETYKQWHVRNTRGGFKPLPINQELMKKFRCKLKDFYHKDFVIDEDNNWMLQGWKGRIMYASSCWMPRDI